CWESAPPKRCDLGPRARARTRARAAAGSARAGSARTATLTAEETLQRVATGEDRRRRDVPVRVGAADDRDLIVRFEVGQLDVALDRLHDPGRAPDEHDL